MARYYPSRNDIDKPDKLERVVRDIYDRLYKRRSVTSTSTTTPVESGGGAPGPVGPQGPAGPAGAKGAKGDTGPQGEKGDTGDGGATIVWIGDQISANGVLGPSLTGPAGPAGADGAAGATGPQGPQGVQGIQGIQGIQGDPGEGVPAAGTTGQVLTKTSDTDYDTEWADPTGSSLPAGGTTGQVLAKASDADDDVEWVDQSGGGWVDRGDPATDDITLASLLADNSWHDLDLSAIVPVGAKIIRLLLRSNPGTSSARKIYFRKNGNSNTYSITGVEHETEWHYKMTVVDVFCDSNRIIEYLVSGTMNTLTIVVIGWYL